VKCLSGRSADVAKSQTNQSLFGSRRTTANRLAEFFIMGDNAKEIANTLDASVGANR
jgi:hypothetical protein